MTLAGLGGALYAHKISFLSPDQFSIIQSIDLLLLVVIGGLGSVHGAFLGAIFLIAMPQAISIVKDYLPDALGQAPGKGGLARTDGAFHDDVARFVEHGVTPPFRRGR